jgi:hypothetical protein
MERRCKGTQVAVARGYAILAWSGPSVDAGTTKPYSVGPVRSFSKHWFDTQAAAEAWVATAPTLRVVRLTVEAYVPVEATDDEIEDWVRCELRLNGSLSGSNPLVSCEFEACDVTVDDIREVA